MKSDNELRSFSPETLKEHQKMFKENPPKLDYEELAEMIHKMSSEMQNLPTFANAIISNTPIDTIEKDFPYLLNFLNKGTYFDRLRTVAANAVNKEGYVAYALFRSLVPSTMGSIFSTGLYMNDEENTYKPALTFYMLYAACHKKFDNPNFVFGDDIAEEFILLDKYVENYKPYVEETELRKSLVKLNAEDFLDIISVFRGALREMKERVLKLEDENDDLSKDIYPKVSFLDDAIKFLSPYILFSADKRKEESDEQ